MGKSFFLCAVLASGLALTCAVPTCPAQNGELVTLLPHESDCTKFYKCETGLAVLYDCPATLHFNPVLEVCDYPEQVGCMSGASTSTPVETTQKPSETPQPPTTDNGGGGNTGAPGMCPEEDGEFVVHFPHEDCTKFWKCDRGVAVEQDCPAGLEFNPVLLVCDYPENAGCSGNGQNPTNVPTGVPTNVPTDTPTTDNGGGSNTGAPGMCPEEDGEFVVHFPHDDCTKFWKCDRGVAVEQDCPAGLEFNPVLLVCDYPENAGCSGNGQTPTNFPTGVPTNVPTDNPTTDNGGGSNTGAPGMCPEEDGEFVVHFPHDDCTKFWKCDRGVAVEQDCPAGLEFNPVLLVCDYPENAGCSGNGQTPTNFPTGVPTNVPTDNPTTDNGGGSNTGAPGMCPEEDGEFVVHFPHDDCTKFWKCDRGVAVEQDCPAGLEFNPVLLVCDYPENAGCSGNGQTPTNFPTGVPTNVPTDNPTTDNGGGSNTGAPGMCPEEDGEFVVHFPHDDCTKFWKCDRGVAVEQDCPAGLEFNPVLLVCDYPENAGCSGNGQTPTNFPTGVPTNVPTDNPTTDNGGGSNTGAPGMCPEEDGEFVVHFPHDDCTKFWKCDRGVAVEQDCPAGLEFNPVLLVCDYPENAGCSGNGQTPTNFPTGVPTNVPTDNPTTDNGGGSNTGAPGMCPEEDGEFVVHFPHDDCTKFWKCDRGVAVEQDCPAGLEFNPVLLVCDYPENAGCSGNGQTPTNFPTGVPTNVPTDNPTTDNGGGSNTGAPGMCPEEDGEFVVHFPHDDCTKFWKCDRGVAVEQDCPAGLEFNPVLLVCDYPENAGCSGNGQTPTNFPTGVPTNVPTDNPTTDNGGGSNTGAPGMCPEEDGEFVVHFPHDDCTKFWKCDRGVAVEQDCPAGLEFNPVLLVCDYPENAGCSGNGQTPTNFPTGVPTNVPTDNPTTDNGGGSNTGAPGMCPEEDGEFVVHFPHDDCTKFWKCDRGVAVEQDCPAGLEFNPVLLVCDYPENAGCSGNGQNPTNVPTGVPTNVPTDTPTTDNGGGSNTGAPGMCPEEDGEFVTLFPHDDCTKFWKCDRGVAVEKECPAGLHFNPVLLVCDYPEAAGCTGGTWPTTPGRPDSTTQAVITTNPPVSTTTVQPPQTTPQATTQGPNPGDGYCKTLGCPELNGVWVYFLRVPGDCTRFCKCDWGTPYEYICPGGLYFNTDLDVCDYRENVKC